MTEPLLPPPADCILALEAIQADPLDLPPQAEAHVTACRACAEARVLYLALEEPPEALAPTGYHDRLPERVLRKLPTRPLPLRRRIPPLGWAAAAALLMAVGAGAFWAGRANRTPLVEATLPRQPEIQDPALTLSDTPFHDREEDAAQVQSLTPEEMRALLKRLEASPASPQ